MKTTGAALVVLGGSVIAALAAFLTRLVLARVLDPPDLGRLAIAIAWASALGGIASLGAASASAHTVAGALARGDREGARHEAVSSLRLAAGCGVLAAVLLAWAGSEIAQFLGRDHLAPVLMAIALVAATLPVGLAALGVARGFGDAWGKALWRDVGGGLARLAGVAVAAAAAAGPVGLAAGYAAGSLFGEGSFLWFVHRRFVRGAPIEGRAERLATRLRALRPFAASTALRQVVQNADTILLGALAAPAAAGIYSVARGTGRVLEIAAEAAAHRFLPDASAAAAHDGPSAVARSYFASRRLAWALLAPGLAVCLFVPVEALSWVFGDAYVSAALPLRLLAAGVAVNAALGYNDRALIAAGHAREATRGQALGAIAGFSAMLALAPRWEAVGAAASWLILVLVENGWWSWRLFRISGVGPDVVRLLPVCGVALVLPGACVSIARTLVSSSPALAAAALAAGLAASAVLLLSSGGERRRFFRR